jgi:hypothetical protein
MPVLLISRVDGVWQASPANSGVSYAFVQADGTQDIAVQQLAVAMQQGTGALVNGVPEIFVLPDGVQAEQVVQTLFGTTDVLTYVSRIIYGVVGEDMLLDEIAQAGLALAAALVAA